MKIRVLHCLETIGPGGVEQRRLSIAKYLDAGRFEQKLLCAKVIGDFDKRLEHAGTRVQVVGVMKSPFNFAYFIRLIRMIRTFQPHIIHGAVFEGVISAVVGGVLTRTPVIIVEETSEPANRSWRGHALFRFLTRFADAVVGTSPAVFDYITKDIGVPPSKARLIINGVEPPEVASPAEVDTLRKQLGIRQGDYIVGTVGRMLDNHKLFSVLIRAFAGFAANKPEVKLLLVGDGVDIEMLKALAQQTGMGSRIIFTGHQTKVSPYYQCMDVFALTPAREGFGLAAVEAMFHQLPVIASKVGGLRYVVNEQTGILVEPGNESELQMALERLHADRSLASSLGAAGRLTAHEKYTAQRYVKDVEKLYNSFAEKLTKEQE